jgi:hypothetical protein
MVYGVFAASGSSSYKSVSRILRGEKDMYIPRVMNYFGQKPRPSALVGCTQSTASVGVEKFVEPQVVFPVLVKVKKVVFVVDGTSTVIVPGIQVL